MKFLLTAAALILSSTVAFADGLSCQQSNEIAQSLGGVPSNCQPSYDPIVPGTNLTCSEWNSIAQTSGGTPIDCAKIRN